MRGADQAGLVGIVADQLEIDVDTVGLEQYGGSGRRPALPIRLRAESAADDETLRVAPLLDLETANDLRKLLGEVLDGALDDAGRFRLAARSAGYRPASSCRSPRWPCRREDPRRGSFSGLRHLSRMSQNAALAGLVADEAVLVGEIEVLLSTVTLGRTAAPCVGSSIVWSGLPVVACLFMASLHSGRLACRKPLLIAASRDWLRRQIP